MDEDIFSDIEEALRQADEKARNTAPSFTARGSQDAYVAMEAKLERAKSLIGRVLSSPRRMAGQYYNLSYELEKDLADWLKTYPDELSF